MEEALLGAILLERDKLEDVLSIITTPDVFYKSEHQVIFSAIRDLFYSRKPVDSLMMIEHLRSTDQLEDAGGAYYITKLTLDVVSSAHAIAHAQVVKEKYLLREIIKRCGNAIAKAFDQTTDVFELIDQVGTEIDAMVEETIAEDMEVAEDVYNEVLQKLDEARVDNRSITGVPTNIRSLDAVTCGWQKTDLIILAARPSVGKTALALNWAYNASICGVNVAVFSLEMTKSQLVQRLLSISLEVPANELKRPSTMTPQNWSKVTTAPGIGNGRIYLDDTPSINPFLLKAKVKRMMRKRRKATGKAEDWLIIVDYLQLMKWPDKLPREQEIASISRTLKEIAKELDVPVIALSQMSRDYEKGARRKPQLSDLRESGAIEQDADTIMFLSKPSDDDVREEPDLKNIGYLDILKHRSGELANIELFKDLRFQLFKDLSEKSWNEQVPPTKEELYNPRAGFDSVEDDLPF